MVSHGDAPWPLNKQLDSVVLKKSDKNKAQSYSHVAKNRSGMWCLPHFIAATACQEADYGWMIRHYCLQQFQRSMDGIGQRLWCDWDETVGTYGELTNCTALIAERLDCYWPNRLVDEFFVAVHKQYFRNCSPSGRALHDPPNGVLCPFIVLPVLVTLLMTALVAAVVPWG
uniref:Receptor activity-modifying protein 1 n=1 Tax=Zosterops lateralis melanops TaxID=1220523 RepID=A0A8D2PXT3_ZOSLA